MNALLFSLPGTPVIYYGDEIGMGDNVYLGDRDAVRTPMQWSADRNAGFSDANPQRLYLPAIIDPEYHYESVNVEAQHDNPDSLLWWMRRLIALRQPQPGVRARRASRCSRPTTTSVLAFLRRHEGAQVLVVANLSRYAQYVELDLHEFRGAHPVELFGQTSFPAIGDLPYLLTLGPHAFYWLALEPAEVPDATAPAVPPVSVVSAWTELLVAGQAVAARPQAAPAPRRPSAGSARRAARSRAPASSTRSRCRCRTTGRPTRTCRRAEPAAARVRAGRVRRRRTRDLRAAARVRARQRRASAWPTRTTPGVLLTSTPRRARWAW